MRIRRRKDPEGGSDGAAATLMKGLPSASVSVAALFMAMYFMDRLEEVQGMETTAVEMALERVFLSGMLAMLLAAMSVVLVLRSIRR